MLRVDLQNTENWVNLGHSIHNNGGNPIVDTSSYIYYAGFNKRERPQKESGAEGATTPETLRQKDRT